VNLPNGLTVSRIFLAPLLVVLLLTSPRDRELWAFAVLVAASVTDCLDGYLARKRLQVTTLGKLLDPIADKLLISAAFISLVELKIAPAWMVVIIVGREFAVTGLRSIAVSEGFTISASRLGKYKMATQVICVGLLVLGTRFPQGLLSRTGRAFLWVVVVLALVSMVQYFYRFWNKIDASYKTRRKLRNRKRMRLLRKQRQKSDAIPEA